MVTIVHFVSTFLHRKAPELTTLQRHQVCNLGEPFFGGIKWLFSHQKKKKKKNITQVERKTEKCKLCSEKWNVLVNLHYCDGFCSNVHHRVTETWPCKSPQTGNNFFKKPKKQGVCAETQRLCVVSR